MISIQTFGGFGHGNSKGDVENVFRDTSAVFTKSDFNRYSIQANLTLKDNNPSNLNLYRNYGLAFRISAVDFYNLKSEIGNRNQHFTNLYLEYGAFSQFGFNNFKLQIQGFFLTALTKELDTRTIFFFLSLGMDVNFSL